MRMKGLYCVLVLFIWCCTIVWANEYSSDSWSSNRVDLLSRQSDLVAHVLVTKMDYIRKPTQYENGNIVADVFSFGRLITLDVMNIYETKTTKAHSTLYIFQKGAVAGLEQARLHEGDEYIVFLKESSPPKIVNDNTETVPKLPQSPYYSLLQQRKGALAKDKTNLFIRVSQQLGAKMKLKIAD